MLKLERTVTIINKLGLHARPAAKLAQLCQAFDATVTLSLAGKQANANSIMAIMLLAGSQGKSIKVITEGADAQQALDDICQLITDKFLESE